MNKRLRSVLSIGQVLAMMGQNRPKGERPVQPIRPARGEIIPKGCKVFMVNGARVVALNEENAIRKYEKQKMNRI